MSLTYQIFSYLNGSILFVVENMGALVKYEEATKTILINEMAMSIIMISEANAKKSWEIEELI
jgi:hypothetical protein